MDYFTQNHFDLLKKWQGIKSAPDNLEQKEDYPELKKAYEITEHWAKELQQKMFPEGKVKLRKSPVNQGGKFIGYNWAKIYPTKNDPEEVAYTVGISNDGFTVKIDTVNVKKALRDKYEKVRGDFYASEIVRSLSIAEGLKLNLNELVYWSEEQINGFGMSYSEVVSALKINEPEADYNKPRVSDVTQAILQSIPLNQILYGPPGTGKTYHTIEKAVMAAEPTFAPTAKSKDELRSAFKAKYDELVASDRIRFVTFHQSYGYEEFVEGLSAKTDGDKLSYYQKDGVFKLICDNAKRSLKDSQKTVTELNDEYKFNEALEIFKLSMFDDADIYPLTDACSILTIESDGFRYGGNWNSSPIMKFEDLKSLYLEDVDSRQGIKKSANVSGLAKQHASYFIRALEAIKKHIPKSIANPLLAKKQNYVLIIDEINRGNISKIFGELITLVESSKRYGQPECIEVTLPYSGKPFSVPYNLYIIGTMNTADRSLALMDTALRRRFDFVEMMPDYSVLNDDENQPYCIHHSDNPIDLVALLSTLNKRISALYDREHTLGHAFLIPVIDAIKANNHQGALTELANCFKNKLIPLLAEYFFEDWQKIRLVLGDNQKQQGMQLIQEKKVDFESLFGDTEDVDVIDDEANDYQLIKADSTLWQDPLTYIGMYKPSAVGE